MKESHRKDLAGHPDPESCDDDRKGVGEALTGAHADQPLSCEIKHSGVPTPLVDAEGNAGQGGRGEFCPAPAQSKTLRMREHSLHGNRETPRTPTGTRPAGRSEKAIGRTSDMHVRGESDGSIVPENLSNKGEGRWLVRHAWQRVGVVQRLVRTLLRQRRRRRPAGARKRRSLRVARRFLVVSGNRRMPLGCPPG